MCASCVWVSCVCVFQASSRSSRIRAIYHIRQETMAIHCHTLNWAHFITGLFECTRCITVLRSVSPHLCHSLCIECRPFKGDIPHGTLNGMHFCMYLRCHYYNRIPSDGACASQMNDSNVPVITGFGHNWRRMEMVSVHSICLCPQLSCVQSGRSSAAAAIIAYTAPELLVITDIREYRRAKGAECDIYSVGVILWEMLSGQ